MGETPISANPKENEGYARDETTGYLYLLEPDGKFSVLDPATNIADHGDTREAAMAHLAEAIKLYHMPDESYPPDEPDVPAEPSPEARIS